LPGCRLNVANAGLLWRRKQEEPSKVGRSTRLSTHHK
jgi:hypothetical protein